MMKGVMEDEGFDGLLSHVHQRAHAFEALGGGHLLCPALLGLEMQARQRIASLARPAVDVELGDEAMAAGARVVPQRAAAVVPCQVGRRQRRRCCRWDGQRERRR